MVDVANPESPSIVDRLSFPYYFPVGVAFVATASAGPGRVLGGPLGESESMGDSINRMGDGPPRDDREHAASASKEDDREAVQRSCRCNEK